MGSAIKFTEDEIDALHGCSPEAVKLYMCGIRPRMCFKTGYVGRKTRFCYQALREVMSEYAPPVGSHIRDRVWSRSALKCRLSELVEAGLINWIKVPSRGLLFKCVLSVYDKCQQFLLSSGAAPSERPHVKTVKTVKNELVVDKNLAVKNKSSTPPPELPFNSLQFSMHNEWNPDRQAVNSVCKETVGIRASGIDDGRYQAVIKEFVGFWSARSSQRNEHGWLCCLATAFAHNARVVKKWANTERGGFNALAVGESIGLQPRPGESTYDFSARVRSATEQNRRQQT